MRQQTLYDPPRLLTFEEGEDGRAKMMEALNAANRGSLVASPSSPRDLSLDYVTRKTHQGFRYTSEGFSRVCKATARSMSQFVEHIAGSARQLGQIGEHLDAFSLQDACQIFNIAINRRFHDWLSRYRLVSNVEAQTIDGFIGPMTHFMPNADYMDLASSVLPTGVEFAGASLAGRRLFARYLLPETIETLYGRMREGFAFVVAEAGDDAVRAYRTYQGESGGALLQSVVAPLRRTGKPKKFKQRLKELLFMTIQAEAIPIKARLTQLKQNKLFADTRQFMVDKACAHWRRELKLAHVPPNVAERVVTKMVTDEDPSVPRFTEDQLRMKTEFDLMSALLQESIRSNQRNRELLEKAAHTVFFGE